ncbi:MAG TPA: ATP-binding cassette domain-containing protein [Mycobacteriales bacterium]|nr:ATP-binding cassette domain-containing protein [Mycobacteriales bacterium]
MTAALRRGRPTAGALVGLVLLWLLLRAVLPHGAPLGIIVVGAIFGAINSLVAISIVLVYRASRVVNFAAAELGSVAAVLAIELHIQEHLNYFAAVLVGLLAAAVIGALAQITVFHKFANAPRLIVAVATIGLAQILNGLSILIPLSWGGDRSGTFTTPWSVHFRINPVVFTGNHVIALIVVPTVLLALTWFLRTTYYGVAIRAAADNGDRAKLLGIPTERLAVVVWVITGLLSALAVLLRVPIQGFASFESVSSSGLPLLLATLAAAVIGGMTNLPVTVVAAVGLGIVDQLSAWTFRDANYVDVALLVVILVALLVKPNRLTRAVETGIGGWQAVRPVRPIPPELARAWPVRIGSRAVVLGLVAVALLLPRVLPDARTQLVTVILIYAIVACSLVVLTGWSGHVSLGQVAFMGFGASTTAVLVTHHGVNVVFAVAAGTAVAATAAVVVGVPALRISGPFLAVTTLAFAVAAANYLLVPRFIPWFNTTDPLPGIRLFGRIPIGSDREMYYVVLVALGAVIAAVRHLRSATAGRAMVATNDNPLATQAFGIDTTRTKLASFAVSGGIAGLAGGLFVVQQQAYNVGSFNAEQGLAFFTMVVIGGLGSLPGAILGAFYVYGAQYFLPAQWSLLATGAGLITVLQIMPGGLGEILYRSRDLVLRRFAVRRGIAVPSLTADRLDAIAAEPRRTEPAEPASGAAAASLLSCRQLAAGYGGVQVLFDVALDVAPGEIVALLGTNGAGKSTLLKAITGLVRPSAGSVTFDGVDITRKGPNDCAARGVMAMPGGRGVFPTMTVADNLKVAGWMSRKQPGALQSATEQAFDQFPVLRTRMHALAGDLSGGEQQMLSLAMAFITEPRLLLIDELSLGLAPAVVARLGEMLRRINERGTTIVLVEQSVNTALSLAERAVFLEKGEVRFTGPTRELLERPDILRAVFLAGTAPQPRRRSRATARSRAVAEAPAVLEIRDVTKRYGGVTAVNGVSFDLHAGEILGFIGPNGAGKTTLFDIITGFAHPDAGSITLFGTDVTGAPAAKRAAAGLGRSFQDARLWPTLTVAESLAVSLHREAEISAAFPALLGIPGVSDAERAVHLKVDELVDLMNLGAYRNKFIAELSTGTRRMVELGCMLAHRPRILLLDEPSSGIAQRETEALGPVLQSVRDQLDCSVLIVEHDMPLITSLADRLIALDLGAVIAEGAPDVVLRDPLVVESYLGADPPAPPKPRAQRARGATPKPRRARPAAPKASAAKSTATKPKPKPKAVSR